MLTLFQQKKHKNPQVEYLYGAASPIFWIIGAVLKLFLIIESYLLFFIGKAMDFLVKTPANVALFDAVEIGWVVVRDTFNMFFILFLLIIAFATILRIESWNYKRLLPRLIIAILLVNFSRTICAFFIEFADLMMRSFTLGLGNRGIVSSLIHTLGLKNITDISNKFEITQINDVTMAAGLFMVVAFLGIFILGLTGITILLSVRLVALMLLTIFSPAAFMLDVLPATQQYAKKWWSEFFKYVFYGPAATFCLYLAIHVSNSFGKNGIASLLGSDGNKVQFAANQSILPQANFDVDHFLRFALVMSLIFVSLFFVRSLGAFGSAALMGLATAGLAKGVGMYGRAWGALGKYAVGKPLGLAASGASGAIRRSLYRGNQGLIGRGFGFAAGAVGAALGGGGEGSYGERRASIAQNAGNWVRFASPTLVKDAWNARQERLEREASMGASGYVRNAINDRFNSVNEKVFRGKQVFGVERVDYESQEIGRAVDKEKEEMDLRNPSRASDQYIFETVEALKKGQPVVARAGIERLITTTNLNDLVSEAASGNYVDNEGKPQVGELSELLWGDWAKSDYFKEMVQEGKLKDDAYSRVKMLDNLFGRDQAVNILRDTGQKMMGRGVFDLGGLATYTKDGEFDVRGWDEVEKMQQENERAGRQVWSEADMAAVINGQQGAYAAGHFQKQGARDQGKSSAFSSNLYGYDSGGSKVVMGASNKSAVEYALGMNSISALKERTRFKNEEAAKQWRDETSMNQRKNIAVANLVLRASGYKTPLQKNALTDVEFTSGGAGALTEVAVGAGYTSKDEIKKNFGEAGGDHHFAGLVQKALTDPTQTSEVRKIFAEFLDPRLAKDDKAFNKVIEDARAQVLTASGDLNTEYQAKIDSMIEKIEFGGK